MDSRREAQITESHFLLFAAYRYGIPTVRRLVSRQFPVIVSRPFDLPFP